jgi:hypothetical protein
MTIEEMIKQALGHKHTPDGQILWSSIDDEDSTQRTRCKCGVELVRHTAPLGAKHNWEDWEISQ